VIPDPGLNLADYICGHCGQICGDRAGGLGVAPDGHGYTINVCHPDTSARPDCYRRITVYGERPGALIPLAVKPAGVEEIRL
jgi:hypothetical protein